MWLDKKGMASNSAMPNVSNACCLDTVLSHFLLVVTDI